MTRSSGSHPRPGTAVPRLLRGALALLVGLAFTAPAVGGGGRAPFHPGEVATFAVKYGPVRAGTATLSVFADTSRGERLLRLESRARSSDFFTRIFEVDDRVSSWWDPARGHSVRYERKVHEGNYRKEELVEYDHDRGVAVYADGSEVELLEGALDVLASFYYVRTRRLAPGDTISIPNHDDRENHTLAVAVLGREEVEVPAGRFRCVVVEPLLTSAGLFQSEGRLTIWLTDDGRHIPVLMKSKVKVGSIVAELESYRPGIPAGAGEPSGDRAGGDK